MEAVRNLKVLSLEQATVVPYLTYRLAMDGMEVIRLEHPVYGDPNRLIGDNVLNEERMNAYFLCINAGKKALTLNLADPRGQELLQKLIKQLDIDIFITNQLPRNYRKLGIDYETLRAARGDIIWLGVTGFGPDSDEGAYDPILQARSGLMELTGPVSWLTVPITMTASFDKKISRRGNTHEFFAPVSVYQTRNGFIYLAVGNDRQWKTMVSQELFQSLDKPEYEKNMGRIKDVSNLNTALNAITRTPMSGSAFFQPGIPKLRPA